MKRCTKCGEEKDESEFHKNKQNRDGKKSWCKLCFNHYASEYQKSRYQTDPSFKAKNIAILIQWYKDHPHATYCKFLKRHHEEMKDDPEHLTTEFLQSLIGVDCGK